MHQRAFAIAASAFGLLVVGQFVARPPVALRFEVPIANYLTLVLACIALLSGLGWFAMHASARPLRWVLWVLCAALFLPLAPLSACALLEIPRLSDGDLSSIKLAEHPLPNGVLRLYRTDCGATCAYGLALNLERTVIPGVKLVRPLWSAYRVEDGVLRSSEATVQVVSDGKVLFAFEP